MNIGMLFLKVITTGIISDFEISWIANNQVSFSKCEQSKARELGELFDSGAINLGCRI